MKKVLTILLALLVVTGVVFANDPTNGENAGTAKVDIFAKQSPVLEHKITAGTAGVIDLLSWSNVDAVTEEKEVLLNSTDPQLVGFYSVKTNMVDESIEKINLTATPLENDLGESGVYYIPYTVQVVGLGEGNVDSGSHDFTAGVPEGDDPTDAQVTLENFLAALESSRGEGLRVESREIKVIFAGGLDGNVPEGKYTATISVNIVAD